MVFMGIGRRRRGRRRRRGEEAAAEEEAGAEKGECYLKFFRGRVAKSEGSFLQKYSVSFIL